MAVEIPEQLRFKVIPTSYKGCLFRSRLEARWAVFFDSLNLKWEYEKEGFEFEDGTRYLPDFWLPELNCFIEIKGEEPPLNEQGKHEKLCETTKKDIYVFFGQITQESFPHNTISHCYDTECKCAVYNLSNTTSFFLDKKINRILQPEISTSVDYANYYSKLDKAYHVARSARFEWGENNVF